MRTKLVRHAAVLILIAALATLPTAHAGAGETVSSGAVELERRITEVEGGCRAIWWIVVDDLPDVAQYSVELERSRPFDVQRTETFNRYSSVNQWEGTEFDHPAAPDSGRVHHPWATSTSFPCSESLFHEWEAVDVEITRFTPDPPVPGRAAIELDLVGNGASCQSVMWASVPRVPTAREYRIEYTTGLENDRVFVNRRRLAPGGFDSSPALPDGFRPYRTPGRLGHFVRSATGENGCAELAWRELVSGPAHIVASSASFEVTTAPCFGRQPTIVAVPGRPTRGTPGADVILGTNGDDVIRGLGGDDLICGLGGNDRILGGRGNDSLDGGSGRDLLDGGPGRDQCVAQRRDTTRRCEPRPE